MLTIPIGGVCSRYRFFENLIIKLILKILWKFLIKNLKKQKKIYLKKKEKVPMNIEDLIKELTELEESRKRQVKKGISSGTTPLIIHINGKPISRIQIGDVINIVSE